MKPVGAFFLAKAAVYTWIASLAATLVSVFVVIPPGFFATANFENQIRRHHDVWAELLWAPIFETLIMMLIWKVARVLGSQILSTGVFLFAIVGLAFIAHGGYPRGVSPAAAFVVFSFSYVVMCRKHSELHGFFVVSSAHALCNLVFVIGRWARELG